MTWAFYDMVLERLGWEPGADCLAKVSRGRGFLHIATSGWTQRFRLGSENRWKMIHRIVLHNFFFTFGYIFLFASIL